MTPPLLLGFDTALSVFEVKLCLFLVLSLKGFIATTCFLTLTLGVLSYHLRSPAIQMERQQGKGQRLNVEE